MTDFNERDVRRDSTGRFSRQHTEEPTGGTSSLPTPNIVVIERELPARNYDGHRWSEWWLERDGVTVAYMQTHLYPDDRGVGAPRLMLCDIEVRDGYRGQGLARHIIEHVEAELGEKMHTTGSFTPLGAAAFMGKMPSPPWEEPGIKYDDMTFVVSWDDKHGPH